MKTNFFERANLRLSFHGTCMLIALLLASSVAPAWSKNDEATKKVTHDYSFKVNKDDLLRVDNRFGNITVTHWDKKEVSIHIVIESKSSNERQAQQNLDRVTVTANQYNQEITALTSLKERNWNSSGNEERLTINYFIKMPATLQTDLTQKYGNIYLPDKNEGKSVLNIKYGNLQAGDFTKDLDLEIKYGNANIGSVTTAILDLGYCGNVSLLNAEKLDMDAKYSHVNMQNIKRLILENKYGNVRAEKIEKADMEIKYGETKVETIEKELVLDISYSTLTVREVASDFQRIDIDAHYGNVNLYFSPTAAFKVNAEDIKYGKYDISGFNSVQTSVEEKVNHYSKVNGGSSRTVYFEGNNYSNLRIKSF